MFAVGRRVNKIEGKMNLAVGTQLAKTCQLFHKEKVDQLEQVGKNNRAQTRHHTDQYAVDIDSRRVL